MTNLSSHSEPTPAAGQDNPQSGNDAAGLRKAELVCRRAAAGDLEARITGLDDHPDFKSLYVAINSLLDLADAFVRESGASLEFASRQQYHRPFLLRGMPGDFRRGATIINTARESMKRRHELTESFQSTVSKVVEVVSVSSGQLEGTARDMLEDAETTRAESAQVAAASDEATQNAEAVAASSEELSASIGEISRQVSECTEATRGVVEEVQRAGTAVEALSEAAKKIDTVVEFIQNIAHHTNLLALNATIEAARAGAAGRGFAIVAQEVKTLAGQAGDATKEIVAQVKSVQKASGDTAVAMDGISERIRNVDEVTGAIAAAIEEQSAATQEIGSNVQQTAQAAGGISGNIAQIAGAAEKTGAAAQDVLGAASNLSGEADGLKTQVDDFLEAIRVA